MCKTMKKRSRTSRQRGSTMYEFAWVLPFILLTLGAMFDFGRTMYAYHFISYAAREGARFASVRGSSSFVGCPGAASPCPATAANIQSFVQSFAPPGLTYVSGAAVGQTGFLGIDQTSTDLWPGTGSDGTVNSGTTYSPCGPPPSNSPGCVVSVKVEYSVNFFLLNIFGRLIKGSSGQANVTMESTASEVITQ